MRKWCGKGGDRMPSSSWRHSYLNCEKYHPLLQPLASPCTPFKSEAASCSQSFCSLLPASFVGRVYHLHEGCGHMVDEALAVVPSSFPPKPHPIVLFLPSCKCWKLIWLLGEPAQGIKPIWKYTSLSSGLFFHQVIALKGLNDGCQRETVLAQLGAWIAWAARGTGPELHWIRPI